MSRCLKFHRVPSNVKFCPRCGELVVPNPILFFIVFPTILLLVSLMSLVFSIQVLRSDENKIDTIAQEIEKVYSLQTAISAEIYVEPTLTFTTTATETMEIINTISAAETLTFTSTSLPDIEHTPSLTMTPISNASIISEENYQKLEQLIVMQDYSGSINSIDISPNSQMLVSVGSDGIIKIWDLTKGKKIVELVGHEGSINSVVFSPDGSRIASGSDDNLIIIWDVNTGKEVVSLLEHSDSVTGVDFSPDGTLLISSSLDKSFILWDVENIEILKISEFIGCTSNCYNKFNYREMPPSTVKFSNYGRLMAIGGDIVDLVFWDPLTWDLLHHIGTNWSIHDIAFSHDDVTAVAVSDSWTPRVIEVSSGNTLFYLYGHNGIVKSVDYSSDSSLVATGSIDGTIFLWNAANGEFVRKLDINNTVTSVRFSPDGRYLASGSANGAIILWGINSDTE